MIFAIVLCYLTIGMLCAIIYDATHLAPLGKSFKFIPFWFPLFLISIIKKKKLESDAKKRNDTDHWDYQL